MAVERFLREDGIAETRWVAIDQKGSAVSVFTERNFGAPQREWQGKVLEAIVRAIRPAQGGAFLELETGAPALLRLKSDIAVREGQRLSVQIVAEARSDKAARVIPALATATGTQTPLEAWQATLNCTPGASIEDAAITDERIARAFDQAIAPALTLPRGGRLRLEPTHALVAADIDTHGRTDKGRAVQRAENINIEAATLMARHAVLRSLGGILVLDCVSPLSRDSAKAVRDAFSSELKSLTRRPCRVLLPSELGLLQVSLAWGIQPIAERLCVSADIPTDESILCDGLRHLQRAAVSDPMKRFTLALPSAAYNIWTKASADLMPQLSARYGARLQVKQSKTQNIDIHES